MKTGTGAARRGNRLLTVGTDCSAGKKYTALAIARDMEKRGINGQFCATGQTGKLIANRGIALDAVVADFISGAVEWLSPEHKDDDQWDVIEGQGSIFHPAFAGVSLGLLHGAQADAFIVCHEPTRTNMRAVSTPLPTIQEVIDQTVALGSRTNPNIRCVGISVNTSNLPAEEVENYLSNLSQEFGVPAVDPVKGSTDLIIDLL